MGTHLLLDLGFLFRAQGCLNSHTHAHRHQGRATRFLAAASHNRLFQAAMSALENLPSSGNLVDLLPKLEQLTRHEFSALDGPKHVPAYETAPQQQSVAFSEDRLMMLKRFCSTQRAQAQRGSGAPGSSTAATASMLGKREREREVPKTSSAAASFLHGLEVR